MLNVYERYTVKSKDYAIKKQILDALTAYCLQSQGINLISMVKSDETLDTTQESSEDIIRLCLFAIYISDVMTVLSRESREFYIKELKQIVEDYGLSYQKVVYLSNYANRFFSEIERSQ